MFIVIVAYARARAGNVGAWCGDSASNTLGTAVPVQLGRRRLAAGVSDTVAGRAGAGVVFAVVVGHAARSGRDGGGGGGVGFGDGEDGDVVVEGRFDGVRGGGGVEVGLLGEWVGWLLGRVCRCLRLGLLRLGLMVLHLRHGCCNGVCLPAAAATHTAPRD